MAVGTKSNRIVRARLTGAAAAVCIAGSAAAQAPDADTALTIYSTIRPGAISPEQYRPTPGQPSYAGGAVPGYAMIRQRRRVQLDTGANRIEFRDVAAYIDPTTVSFESLTAPDSTRVVEQSFQFDLVSTDKLMERYVDQTITVDQLAGSGIASITGKLLSTRGGLVLQSPDGQIHAVRNYQNVHFPELPGGLITRPTLIWDVTTDRAGEHDTRLAYQTAGLTWWADYNLVYREGADANSGTVDVGAWVSILNRSGTGYDDAKLKLVAGDVNRVEPIGPRAEYALEASAQRADAGFEEQSFFEFHLYTLGRTTSLTDDSTKQIELFPQVSNVPVDKVLVYHGLSPGYGTFPNPATERDYGLPMNTKVDVYLELDNDADAGLGIPLPAGRIRVSQLDNNDATLEFIGEDVIDHTPEGENLRIRLGSAFDVVGERRQVEFRADRAAETMEETIEVILRNHKDQSVQVLVREVLFRWTNSEILDSTHEFGRDDARTIHFPVTVPADGEATVRYRVRYTW